jgi:hypothetical protein
VSIDQVIAPGAQGRLFSAPLPGARVRLVVVEANGSRTAPVSHIAVAAAQANAAARAHGRAWIEGSDGRTVGLSVDDGALTVTPREPGWPADIARLITEHACTRKEEP